MTDLSLFALAVGRESAFLLACLVSYLTPACQIVSRLALVRSSLRISSINSGSSMEASTSAMASLWTDIFIMPDSRWSLVLPVMYSAALCPLTCLYLIQSINFFIQG